jgi:predicted AAA+ superfamily ATPase
MYPMDYEEFLWAVNNPSYEIIKYLAETGKPVGESTNRKLMRDFRIYMAVGGMPQAVLAYVQQKNFSAIDDIKREIIELTNSSLLNAFSEQDFIDFLKIFQRIIDRLEHQEKGGD